VERSAGDMTTGEEGVKPDIDNRGRRSVLVPEFMSEISRLEGLRCGPRIRGLLFLSLHSRNGDERR